MVACGGRAGLNVGVGVQAARNVSPASVIPSAARASLLSRSTWSAGIAAITSRTQVAANISVCGLQWRAAVLRVVRDMVIRCAVMDGSGGGEAAA
jgi:hypothetical protein